MASPPTLEQLRSQLLRRWWALSGLLWLTVGSLSLWALRDDIAQVRRYFTWAAVRYGLAYNRPAALGLGLCLGLTVALLVAESRYILFGLTPAEQARLQKLARRIEAEGASSSRWRRRGRD
ncbi:MAG TPA: hypothetical protein VLS96_19135 [Nodosilinea sp.]|nr:hypothetical protein [Nodosilinea sp.]